MIGGVSDEGKVIVSIRLDENSEMTLGDVAWIYNYATETGLVTFMTHVLFRDGRLTVVGVTSDVARTREIWRDYVGARGWWKLVHK